MSRKPYNIVAVNPGHNGSVAVVSDGEVKLFIEEERMTRLKYDGHPYRSLIYALEKYHVDEFFLCGTGQPGEQLSISWTGENDFQALVRKFGNKNCKFHYVGNDHHLGHAALAFLNSGFDKAIALIVDGSGSRKTLKEFLSEDGQPISENIPMGFEAESIIFCNRSEWFQDLYKSLVTNDGPKICTPNGVIDSGSSIVKAYEAVTEYAGFSPIDAGKTMGLAPYGEYDHYIPAMIFKNGRADKNYFITQAPRGAIINELFDKNILVDDKKSWHKNKELLPDQIRNFAYAIQKATEKEILTYIKEIISVNDNKKEGEDIVTNIVFSGGYALNCVANYVIQKNLPPEYNFYVEPISSDAGTALGWAKLAWHYSTKRKELESQDSTYVYDSSQKSLYYGPEYSHEEIEKVLNENLDKVEIKSITNKEVAQLIADKNIVSIFQGRSEAGPRALGNRSILYDPRDPDGRDVVNVIKGREWFRPFAGTILAEDANEWFDMARLEESPFMMYAVDVAADKIDQIPSILHVDGTCRIQTVTEEQNKNYYNLIKEFKEITGIPILFNTSFNLAGDAMVETISDALDTLYQSKLKYLYVADLNLLVTKTIEDPSEKQQDEFDSLDEI